MKELLIKLLMVCVSVLTPIHPVLITVGILIFSDLVLGIWASKKRGEKFSSAALRRTVTKILIYQTAIITGYICEVYLLQNLLPISKIAAGLVGLVEMTSIFENLNAINGQPIFKSLIEKLGSVNDTKK